MQHKAERGLIDWMTLRFGFHWLAVRLQRRRNLRQPLDYDPLEAAITVLGNVKIENPSIRMDTEDAHNRVNLALEYLRLEKERRGA